MAEDLIHTRSPNELRREIDKIVQDDPRSLPEKSKIFSAIARLQKFDVLPETATPTEIDKYITDSSIELNRGIASTKGVPSSMYAHELLYGTMYPGTLSLSGNGIYFAVPSISRDIPAFPRISTVAEKYAAGDGFSEAGSGIITRGVLRSNARVIEAYEMKQFFREIKNRAKSAGIVDVGAFAAALGYDALYEDGLYTYTEERVYVVLNRGALIMQKSGLQVPPKIKPG